MAEINNTDFPEITEEMCEAMERERDPEALKSDTDRKSTAWSNERLVELEQEVLRVDSETQLGQARALACLLSHVAETASEIRPEMIGWAGSLLDDVLSRLELAIEREMLKPHTEVHHA